MKDAATDVFPRPVSTIESARAWLVNDVDILTTAQIDMLFEHRLPRRGFGALVGPPGAGKTFMAIDIAGCVASGLPWLGARVLASSPVIMVQAEASAGSGARILAWKQAHNLPLTESIGLWTWRGPVNLLDDKNVRLFVEAVRPKHPGLIVLDTWARCLPGGDENSAKDTGVAIGNVDFISRELDAFVLALHHVNAAGERERGSTALRGAVDSLLMLSPSDDVIRFSCEKQRELEAFAAMSLRLVPQGPSCVLRFADTAPADTPDTTLTHTQAKMLDAIRSSFGTTRTTGAELQKLLPGLIPRTFYRVIGRLVDLGYVDRSGKSRPTYGWTGKLPGVTEGVCDTATDTPVTFTDN